MGQNALGKSDCRIFKSTISLEQNNKKAWFFAFVYRFMEIEADGKILGWVYSKMGVATLFSGL